MNNINNDYSIVHCFNTNVLKKIVEVKCVMNKFLPSVEKISTQNI